MKPDKHPGTEPTLVLMAGLSGSGKSTLALALGRALGWPVLDKDSIKAPLLELGADESLAGQASYVLLYQMARDLMVQQGLSVVFDTAASYPRVIQATSQIARDAGGVLRAIHCAADVETRRVRLASRAARLSQPTEIGLAAGDGRITYEHLPPDTLYLDTTRPLDVLLARAIEHVRQ